MITQEIKAIHKKKAALVRKNWRASKAEKASLRRQYLLLDAEEKRLVEILPDGHEDK